jgi:hypothetical protein
MTNFDFLIQFATTVRANTCFGGKERNILRHTDSVIRALIMHDRGMTPEAVAHQLITEATASNQVPA